MQMPNPGPRSNNEKLAALFHIRLRAIRKLLGTKDEVAAQWGMPLIGVYSIEKKVGRALQTVARHADRLGIIVTYDVSLKRESANGKPMGTPPK